MAYQYFKKEHYHECGLPPWLEESIERLLKGEAEKDSLIDCYYCELQSDINVAEFGEITSEQAWFLREKYLGLSKENEL